MATTGSKNKLKQLSGVFKATFVSFVAILAFAVYEFILPIFTESKAESFAIVGVIVSLVYAASFFSEMPVGLMVDKYGRIKIITIAMAGLGILGLFYFFTKDIVALAIMSLIFGVVSVAFWIPSAVLVRDFSPHKMLCQAEGIYLNITQIGWIMGPILAGFIGIILSNNYNFLIVAALMFISAILGLMIFKGQKAKKFKQLEKGHKHKAKLSLMITLFKEFVKVHKHAAPVYFLTMIAYIWTAIEWTFIALAGIQRFGLPESWMGVVLSAMMAVQGTLLFFSGYMMDKIGKRYIITAGFLLLFSSSYFMFLSTNPAIFIFAALMAAASISWILPGTEAILTDIVPKNLYGEMSGVFDTSKDLGLIIGPLAGGFLALYLVNPLAPFLLVTIVSGGAALLSGFIFWPEKKQKRTTSA